MAMIVSLILGLLILITGLALVLGAALRRRLAWGLAIIVLPLAYPVYALLDWKNGKVRNGFLISVAGALVVSAAMYGGVAKQLPFSEAREIADKVPTALPPDGPLPNEAAANAVVLPPGIKFDPLADERFGPPAPPLSPKGDRQVAPPPPAPEFAYYELRREDAPGQLGKALKIVTREGKVEEGVLVSSGADSVLLERPQPGGTAAFEYRFQDLVAMYVYDRRPPASAAARNVLEPDAIGEAPARTDPSEDENGMPEALLDLPQWAVPDADKAWQLEGPDSRPETSAIDADRNQAVGASP